MSRQLTLLAAYDSALEQLAQALDIDLADDNRWRRCHDYGIKLEMLLTAIDKLKADN